MARMELPVLDKFCFIFDLKTGCVAMGIINAILTLISALILCAFAVDVKEMSEIQLKKEDSEAAMTSVVYTIVVLLVILQFLKSIVDFMFLYGIYKERASIIKKYCIFWIVFLILFIIGFLKSLFHMAAGYVIAQIIYLAVNFYFIVVIRSYLISINEDGVL